MNAAKLQASLQDLHAVHDDHSAAIREVVREADALIGERVVIAQILADFYRATLSVSSVQPVLDLAVQLNPSLAPKLTIVKPMSARNRRVDAPFDASIGEIPSPAPEQRMR